MAQTTVEQYQYWILGGCGKTELTITIENSRFSMHCFHQWMGCDQKVDTILTGDVIRTSAVIRTLVLENTVTFRLIDLTERVNFDEYDHEAEAVVAGNCDIIPYYTHFLILSTGAKIPDKCEYLKEFVNGVPLMKV